MTTSPLTALVVEDDEIIRRVVSVWLEESGWTVAAVATADEGLAVVSTLKPNLAVCDVRLPGIHDGMWLAMELLARTPHTRVIFATGVDNLPGGATLRANVAGYIVKPFRRRDLMAIVADITFGPTAESDWPQVVAADMEARRRQLIADIRAAVTSMPRSDAALAVALIPGETRERVQELTALTLGVCQRLEVNESDRPHLVRAVVFANLGRRVCPEVSAITAADTVTVSDRLRFDVPLETRWALTLLGMPEAGEMAGLLSVVDPPLGHETRRRAGRAAQVLRGLVGWRELTDALPRGTDREVTVTDALMRLRSGSFGIDAAVRVAIEAEVRAAASRQAAVTQVAV